MDRRLRPTKKDMKSEKLEDGKRTEGRNRLTDPELDKLQLYYGLAIRRGSNNLETMKTMYEQLIVIIYLVMVNNTVQAQRETNRGVNIIKHRD